MTAIATGDLDQLRAAIADGADLDHEGTMALAPITASHAGTSLASSAVVEVR